MSEPRFNADGLIPAIAQDATDGRVLMLAWMDAEALRRTVATRRATYWSRSRSEYWVKGETSGHTQHVREVRLDCDGDTVLLRVDQVGPACHTGAPTCFDTGEALVALVAENGTNESSCPQFRGPREVPDRSEAGGGHVVGPLAVQTPEESVPGDGSGESRRGDGPGATRGSVTKGVAA